MEFREVEESIVFETNPPVDFFLNEWRRPYGSSPSYPLKNRSTHYQFLESKVFCSESTLAGHSQCLSERNCFQSIGETKLPGVESPQK